MSILVNTLLTIAVLYMVSSFIGKLLKRHLEQRYPSMDREEFEIESILADGLELEFSKEVRG